MSHEEELQRIKLRHVATHKHIVANYNKMSSKELELAIAKQVKRAKVIEKLSMLILESKLSNYNRSPESYRQEVVCENLKVALDKRIAKAKADGRPMIEHWVVKNGELAPLTLTRSNNKEGM